MIILASELADFVNETCMYCERVSRTEELTSADVRRILSEQIIEWMERTSVDPNNLVWFKHDVRYKE